MAGMIRSIFGMTTSQQRDEQDKQQRALAEQLASRGTNSAVAQFGTGFGAALGRGLMGKLGIEDPEMVKAQGVDAQQQALNDALAAVPSGSPERLKILSDFTGQAGMVEESAKYLGQYVQLQDIMNKSAAAGRNAGTAEARLALDEEKFDADQGYKAAQLGIQEGNLELNREKYLADQDAKGVSQDMAGKQYESLERYRQAQIAQMEAKTADGSKSDPFTPKPPTSSALKQTESIFEDLGVDLDTATTVRYSSDLASRLAIAKDNWTKDQGAKGLSDTWYGDDSVIRGFVSKDKSDGKLQMGGWFKEDKFKP